MLLKPKYAKPYTLVLATISVISIYYFIQCQLNLKEFEIHPAIVAYFVIKSFLIFANFIQPYKSFHFNPVIFRALLNLGTGIILAFLYLQLYNDHLLILTDCGLCLITVFSLMKMHQNRNERQHYI